MFTFDPAPFVPYKNREVLERCRNIKREDMEKHPNPNFRIHIVPSPDGIWIADMIGRIARSDMMNEKVVMICPNPCPVEYMSVAEAINRLNINCRNVHIFCMDEWADENGSIGKAYGYQLGVKHKYKEGMFDQVDRVIYDLKNNPFSRRIMTNIYNHHDLSEMGLYPCAYSMTFNVTEGENGKLVLNGILNQRSQDVLTANNWNVVQYSVLMHMLAQVCDMEVGEFVHVIADAHIYDRHIPLVKELITREPLPAPTFWLNPEIKDFYEFTTDDVRLDNYETHEQIKNIPVAI